jgi:hypothetical protein
VVTALDITQQVISILVPDTVLALDGEVEEDVGDAGETGIMNQCHRDGQHINLYPHGLSHQQKNKKQNLSNSKLSGSKSNWIIFTNVLRNSARNSRI